MENILLVVNLVLASILVLLILVQKSEGGALGIGVSQDNFMLSRSAGNFMSKATAVVATLFIICSLALTIISRGELTPTSSVFSVDGSNQVNGSGRTYVAYCFAEKKGFSKFGKYNGVGATTGQFVYTGFKPAFVMTKIATTGGSDTGGWVIMDNKLYPNNLSNSPVLFANGNYAQSDSYNGEMFSNGFRFNANSVTVNGSGNSYIYMAFAEHPLVSSNGVTATAR